jgi:hypothetical protein
MNIPRMHSSPRPRRRRLFASTLIVSFLTACATGRAPRSNGPFPEARAVEVYRLIADSLYVRSTGRPIAIAAASLDTACVQEDCLPLAHRWAYEFPLWWAANDSASAPQLRDDMIRRVGKVYDMRTVPFRESNLVVAELASIPAYVADTGTWIAFRNSHDGAAGVLKFSPVAFDNDGKQALVFVDWLCGITCGHTMSVYLRRKSPAAWEIVDLLLTSRHVR